MGLSGPSLFERGRCSSFRRGEVACCRSWSLPPPRGKAGSGPRSNPRSFHCGRPTAVQCATHRHRPTGPRAGPGGGAGACVVFFGRPARRRPPVEAPPLARWSDGRTAADGERAPRCTFLVATGRRDFRIPPRPRPGFRPGPQGSVGLRVSRPPQTSGPPRVFPTCRGTDCGGAAAAGVRFP